MRDKNAARKKKKLAQFLEFCEKRRRKIKMRRRKIKKEAS